MYIYIYKQKSVKLMSIVVVVICYNKANKNITYNYTSLGKINIDSKGLTPMKAC